MQCSDLKEEELGTSKQLLILEPTETINNLSPIKAKQKSRHDKESSSDAQTINYDTEILQEMFQMVSLDDNEKKERHLGVSGRKIKRVV